MNTTQLYDSINIYLASSSPRRSQLLTQARIPFTVMPPIDFDEGSVKASDPAATVELLSRGKAENVMKNLRQASNSSGRQKDDYVTDPLSSSESGPELPSFIISADTIVVLEGRILGKPADTDDAFHMLKGLQGRSHEVMTGVTLCLIQKKKDPVFHTFHEITTVDFYPLSDEEIREYISTGEPMDKAGSYGIQGMFARYVKSISGDYNNVVGLPLGRLCHELKILFTQIFP